MMNSRPLNGHRHASLAHLARAVSCTALASIGCATNDLPERKLGNTNDLLVNAAPATERLPVVTANGAPDPFVVGDWVGQAEDLFASSGVDGQRPTYTFPSGSSEIRLRIDVDESITILRGTLSFGSRELPAPQTNVPYGDANNYYFSSMFQFGPVQFAPIEGFVYSLSESGLRLSTGAQETILYSALGFLYAQNQAFKAWCPLQPSGPVGDGRFSCLGAGGLAGADPSVGIPCVAFAPDGSEREVDCDLATLCEVDSGVCTCDEGGCTANAEGPVHTLWVAREGEQLIGHIAGAGFEYGEPGHLMPIGAIRFTRVAP